ncbi:double-stranded RNA binding motif domain-containing protein [Streptomyces sp. NPDC048637]|uniref:double-stranded RNA binding motif domain-containing protein n=1 Tax=Streptomyces sp. NPDC048637 TaxID=3155636 RepID=UPI00341C471B
MTVREVGDKHGIPTKTLRGWLETAIISIGADDRYSGTGADTRQPPPLSAGQLRSLRQGRSPISVVNELAQKQILRDIDWEDSRTGRAHKPLFTFSLTATRADDGSTLRAEGRSTTKAAARTSAAEDLVQQLAAALSWWGARAGGGAPDRSQPRGGRTPATRRPTAGPSRHEPFQW